MFDLIHKKLDRQTVLLEAVLSNQRTILQRLGTDSALLLDIQAKERAAMTVFDDMKTRLDAMNSKASAEEDAIKAVTGVITDLKTENKSLRDQLANANGDPTVIQSVLDGMTALDQHLDAEATATAAINPPA